MVEPRITIICDWCGKTKEIYLKNSINTQFKACSASCKRHLMSKFMKDKWANLTQEEYEHWVDNQSDGHRGQEGKGLTDYHKSLRPAKVSKLIEMMKSPTKEVGSNKDRYTAKGKGKTKNPRLTGDEWMPRGTCTVIAAHHEMLKDDPERLSTAFIQKMCRVDCKCKVNKPTGGEEND